MQLSAIFVALKLQTAAISLRLRKRALKRDILLKTCLVRNYENGDGVLYFKLGDWSERWSFFSFNPSSMHTSYALVVACRPLN